jgi:hypothetical protein
MQTPKCLRYMLRVKYGRLRVLPPKLPNGFRIRDSHEKQFREFYSDPHGSVINSINITRERENIFLCISLNINCIKIFHVKVLGVRVYFVPWTYSCTMRF